MTEAGELLAPVGGVILILRDSWSAHDVARFLERENLTAVTTPLGDIPNAYSVETAPGVVAIEIANRLASREGVRVAAPNMWRQLREK